LWWPLLWVGTAVFVFVLVMLVAGIVRGRRRTDEQARAEARWGEPFIVIGAVGVTGLILTGFFVFSLIQMRAIASQGRSTALTIHVTGHDWWWEADYGNGAVTANEIHIPTGERVRLLLDGGDVIHSFWVPQLAPKRDTIPGKTNLLWLEADEPGRFRGQCAEYCGLQHAHMGLWVYAQRPAEFTKWMSDQARPLTPPVGEAARGMQVFMTSTCVGCHAIRGTTAMSRAGPDLTHLASRDTIAGAFLDNNARVLSDWITDPQDFKPGVVMPPTQLSAADLSALVAFLRGLK
jgi:cytochrome c oxidase subunit 2